MTTRYKTRVFVFKKMDRNEADRVFSVFAEDYGRLDIFAKAIRKTTSKLRSGIDKFFVSDIEFIQGKSRKTLTDATAVKNFNNVVQSLEASKIANGIGKILDNLIKGEEKDKEIFELLEEVFCELDSNASKKRYILLYYYFLWNVLSLLGYRPQVDECSVCHGALNQSNIYFSDKIGGVICKNCLGHDLKSKKINSDIVKILRIIFKNDWVTLSKLKIELVSQKLFTKISSDYYSYILSSHSFKNVTSGGMINTI